MQVERLSWWVFMGYSIVGKGNHSVNHIQKIKPRVEQVCQELGLQYATEENAGRMYINLQGGPATMPPANSYQPGGQHGGFHNQPQGQQHHGQGGHQNQHQQGGYPGQQQQQGYAQNNANGNANNDNEELEKLAKKLLPKLLRKLDGCCTVMWFFCLQSGGVGIEDLTEDIGRRSMYIVLYGWMTIGQINSLWSPWWVLETFIPYWMYVMRLIHTLITYILLSHSQVPKNIYFLGFEGFEV